MLGENFSHIILRNRRRSLIISSIVINLTAGLTFTFVVPGLKGFDWTFLIGALSIYILVATIFAELLKEKLILVLSLSLISSTLGMGWRLWIEWGEFSLVEHMHPLVVMGYPIMISLIILFSYAVVSKLHLTNENTKITS